VTISWEGGNPLPKENQVEVDQAKIDAAYKSVVRTRYRCLTQLPYYGALAMSFKIVICDEFYGNPVETAATDGRHLFVNPDYYMGLTENEKLSLLVHETSHKALAHHIRRGRRDHDMWNEATDHAVNHLITESGLELGEGWLCEDKFKGWSAERVYGEVSSKPPEPPKPPGRGGAGKPGKGTPGKQGTPTEVTVVKKPKQPGEVWDARDGEGKELTKEKKHEEMRKLQGEIVNATSVARDAGNSTGALHERSVNEVLSPSAGWDSLLKDFWSGSGEPCNETWSRPNRRYLPAGIWAPSMEENGLNWVVIAVDVSGSIMQRECDAFIAQINLIRYEVPAERITLVPFNSIVQGKHIKEVYNGDPIPNRFRVGGGTRFECVMNWLKRQDQTPDSLIIFTDLGDCRYGDEPECPVLWATSEPVYHGNGWTNRPPFGDIVEVEVPNG
jgi:predicted metal-dependent peptidase